MDKTANSMKLKRNATANDTRMFRSENIENFAPTCRSTHAFLGGNNFQQKDL